MGHELVHLSQYTALAGQSAGIVTKNFIDLLEYHAYSFEFSLGSGYSRFNKRLWFYEYLLAMGGFYQYRTYNPFTSW